MRNISNDKLIWPRNCLRTLWFNQSIWCSIRQVPMSSTISKELLTATVLHTSLMTFYFREEVIGLWEERRQQFGKEVTCLNSFFSLTFSKHYPAQRYQSNHPFCCRRVIFLLLICHFFCRHSSSCLPPFPSSSFSWHLILWPDAYCNCHFLVAFSELVSLTNIQRCPLPRLTGCRPSSLPLGNLLTYSTRCRNFNPARIQLFRQLTDWLIWNYVEIKVIEN